MCASPAPSGPCSGRFPGDRQPLQRLPRGLPRPRRGAGARAQQRRRGVRRAGGGGFSIGQGPIASSFGSFFDYVRADGGYLELRFRFADRFRSPALASDAGYCWLRTVGRDSTTAPGVGKFVTVMARDTGGRWRFILDSYSESSLAAFDSAPPFEP